MANKLSENLLLECITSRVTRTSELAQQKCDQHGNTYIFLNLKCPYTCFDTNKHQLPSFNLWGRVLSYHGEPTFFSLRFWVKFNVLNYLHCYKRCQTVRRIASHRKGNLVKKNVVNIWNIIHEKIMFQTIRTMTIWFLCEIRLRWIDDPLGYWTISVILTRQSVKKGGQRARTVKRFPFI